MADQSMVIRIRLTEWVREWDRGWHLLNPETHSPHVLYFDGENPFQAKPSVILNYMRTLWRYKFRKYVGFDSAPDFEIWMDTWLANFDKEDRRLAFTLASRIFFLSDTESRYLKVYVYQRVCELLSVVNQQELLFIDLDGGISLEEFYDLNSLWGYKCATDGMRFDVPPGRLLDPVKELERMEVAEHVLRTCSSFPEKSLKYILDILASHRNQVEQQIADNHEKFQSRRRLVLLVDFVGSGGTANNDLQRILRYYNFEQVFLVALVATDDALERLQALMAEYPSLQVVSGLQITKHHKVLANASTLFSPSEQSAIRCFCEKYYSRIESHPEVAWHGESIKYGFGDCQLLFVRERNTPNNTLPLIWVECEGWVALFRRTSSYPMDKSKRTL